MLTESWHKRLVTLLASMALFTESLDTTIINTAIPAMAHSLQVNPIDLKIALISYLLSLAIFIPISGWIADKFGAKRIFMLALVIFTLSSLWCGFAHNLPELIMARTAQGIGGSLALPVGRLILLRTFARHQLINAMNLVVIVAAFGMMLGPLLGGILTERFSWEWIFWVNIPVGIISFIMAACWLKPVLPQTVPPLDKIGFILFGTSLALFTFGLSALSETMTSPVLAGLIILSALVLFVGYLWHSRTQENPIVSTALLKLRTFQVSAIGNLVSRLGFGAIPFLIPLMLQLTLGYSPEISGLLLAPTALGVIGGKLFSLPILRYLGYKRLLLINTVITGFLLCSFALININTPMYFIAILTFLFGMIMTLQYTGMNSLGYSDVPAEKLSAATSIMGTLQQLSQSFGVAAGAILLHIFSPIVLGKHHLTTNVFHLTFLALGAITVLSLFIFVRLRADDGRQMLSATPPINTP